MAAHRRAVVVKLGVSPEDWPAINTLLDVVLSMPADERSRWLDTLPPASTRFREILARLLSPPTGIETDGLFDALPAFAVDPTLGPRAASQGATAGEQIGPYLLCAELGRGGMGAVWLAERADAQPRRKVALKLPHIGWAPGLRERLDRERDILASLEHPNIARLYDAGVDQQGRPYLALEYVDGTPIDRYASEQGLSIRCRLALVLQVAEAVAHAHAHLVVHRDLKPSNILVTASGDVRLLDFGIAKLLQDHDDAEATELTRQSGRALTPEYASPEQIRGDAVGTASDIYSLGVVAFELLAGRRPRALGKGGLAALAETIAAEAPPLASRIASDPQVARQLSGDLDAILNKALKAEPAERYATVAAFNEDVRRHLDDVPVLARPDSFRYRTRKFVVRNAVQVTAGAVVAIALLVGAGVALWEARVAQAEARRADEVKRFALSIFEQADSDAGAGAKTSAADLLKEAGRRVQRELGDRPAVAVELMASIGYSLLGQDEAQAALDILRDAAALGRASLGEDDRRTVAATVHYGEALSTSGRNDDAIATLQGAIARARRIDDWPDLADAYQQLAGALLPLGRNDEALAASQQALDVAAAAPPGAIGRLLLAQLWGTAAGIRYAAHAPGLTEAARRADELQHAVYGGRLTTDGLSARAHLALGLARDGDVRGSVAEFSAVLRDSIAFHGVAHHDTSAIARWLGLELLEAGDAAGALDAFRTSLLGRNDDLRKGLLLASIGDALAALHRSSEALDQYAEADALMSHAPAAQPRFAWQVASGRAIVLAAERRFAEADRALSLPSASGLTGFDLALWRIRCSEVRRLEGRADEAIALATEALEGDTLPGASTQRLDAERRLGEALLDAGRSADAVTPLRLALDGYQARQLPTAEPLRATAAALSSAEAQIARVVAPSASAPRGNESGVLSRHQLTSSRVPSRSGPTRSRVRACPPTTRSSRG